MAEINPVTTDVKPSDVIAKRPVVSVLVAGALGFAGGQLTHLGGVELDAPATARANGAKLLVHLVHVDQERDGGTKIDAYSTTLFTLPDAGVFKRDNSSRRCAGGASTTKVMATVQAGCGLKAGEYFHVVEFRPIADGGVLLEPYLSKIETDGGRTDKGRQSCDAGVNSDLVDVIFKEAIGCAEQVLDEP